MIENIGKIKRLVFALCMVTLIGFSALGFLLLWLFSDTSISSIFQGVHGPVEQLVYGFALAFFAFGFIYFMMEVPALNQATGSYTNVIKELNPNIHEIIFISFCAGVGEEILFRGAIQTIASPIGIHAAIWIVAIGFVAIHGYLNPKNPALCVYGSFLTIVSAGFGYLFVYSGLIGAMFSHFLLDVLLFHLIIKD